MVIVVGCWRAVQDGADECSCAAVEDVLQDVDRWFAVLIWLGQWGLRVSDWGGLLLVLAVGRCRWWKGGDAWWDR